ncbi:hypothetical protein GCM10010512_06490 [Streptomyces thermoviolaceus subsp. thermoviolaceus]|mgnify:CR=1 FL=1|uniref:XRE family transcriptional regulator n=1 Tax=Streptomyces thermoviolaceus subsp. thermoviolaceus TaxID=66860 RepID=A0ABX0YTN3_STRTL|nr:MULTISPECIES: hypothetical protein [Streptomyces]NJP14438.1 hypothetical protein [Streptomyces thermoviolaceus subsp. thermoviolaceus]RSS06545.1 hypothetical protein EF917_08405 [Streptomyces sp. WAC00469]GHA78461.1 hypothetical protein GCM10010512_06490 [Streptomyces thermoviolaceus subsp. thermoviolaceus]
MQDAPQQPAGARTELDTALRSGPFHVALRAAIAARGLPLQRVQHHLARRGVRVGVTSLSYWQQGARRPRRPESLRAVRALEEILRLPEESLIRLLAENAAGDPDGRHTAARSYRSLLTASAVLHEVLAGLGVPDDGGVQTLGHHERVRIRPSGTLAGTESQHIVRARRDGVDRFVAVHHGDLGCAPERMAVRALENCRTGRVHRHHAAGLLITELLFDRSLRAGESYLFRYGVEDGTAGVTHEYARMFTSAGGQYSLLVRFDTASLPVRCHRFAQPSAAAPRDARQELPVSERHRSVHLVEPRVRPGIVGIGWDWE